MGPNWNPRRADEGDRARALSHNTPSMTQDSPETIGLVAGRDDLGDSEVATLSRDVELYRWVSRVESAFEGMDPKEQNDYWASITDVERNILQSGGVQPAHPNPVVRGAKKVGGALWKYHPVPALARGFLKAWDHWDHKLRQAVQANLMMREDAGQRNFETGEDVFSPGAAPGDTSTGLTKAVAAVGEGVVNAFGPGGEAQDEAIAQVRELGEQGFSGTVFSWLSSFVPSTARPSTWKKYWDLAGEDRERRFSDRRMRSIADRYGLDAEEMDWVEAIAGRLDTNTGDPDVEQIIGGLRDEMFEMVQGGDLEPEDAAHVLEVMEGAFQEDHDIQDAITEAARSRLTPGTAFASNLGINPGQPAFGFASATGDAVSYLVDPIFFGGTAIKATRFLKRGVTDAYSVTRRALRREHRGLIQAFDDVAGVDDYSRYIDDVREQVGDLHVRHGDDIFDPAVRREFDAITGAVNDLIETRVRYLNLRRTEEFKPRKFSREMAEGGVGGAARAMRHSPKHDRVVAEMAEQALGRGEGPEAAIRAGAVRQAEDGTFEVARQLNALDAYRHFTTEAGVMGLLTRQGGGFIRHVPVIPHMNRFHILARGTKNAFTKSINWLDDLPLHMWDDIAKSGKWTPEEQAHILDRAGPQVTEGGFFERIARTVGGRPMLHGPEGEKLVAKVNPLRTMTIASSHVHARAAKYFTRWIPTQRIDLGDPGSVRTIEQLAQLLPSEVGDAMVNLYAATPNPGDRVAVVRTLFDDMFTRLGVKDTQEGGEWAARFLNDMEGSLAGVNRGHAYGVAEGTGMRVTSNGRETPSAIFLSQTSIHMALPDTKTIFALSKRASVWSNLTGSRLFNRDFWDTAVGKAWVPSVLLRLGFPIRATADEVLQFWLREGGYNYFRGKAMVAGNRRDRRLHLQDEYRKGNLSAEAYSEQARELEKQERLLNPVWRITEAVNSKMRDHMGWYDRSLEALFKLGDPAEFARVAKTTEYLKWVGRQPAEMWVRLGKKMTPEQVAPILRSVARHNPGYANDMVDKVMAAAWQGTGGHHRHTEHLSTGERALRKQEGYVEGLDDLANTLAYTQEWTRHSEHSEAWFDIFRGRLAEVAATQDGRTTVRVLDEYLNEAWDEAFRLYKEEGGNLFGHFDSIFRNPEMREKYIRSLVDEVEGDPALLDELLELMPKQLSDGREYLGNQAFDQLIGGGSRGVYYSTSPIRDPVGAYLNQARAGADDVISGLRLKEKGGAQEVLDEVERVRQQGADPGNVNVMGFDYDGDWRVFDPETMVDTEDLPQAARRAIAELDARFKAEGIEEGVTNYQEALRGLREVRDDLMTDAGRFTPEQRERVERLLDEFSDILTRGIEDSGFTAVRHGDEVIVLNPERLQVDFNQTGEVLRDVAERQATRREWLQDSMARQLDEVEARTFTNSPLLPDQDPDRIAVPIPGVLNRMRGRDGGVPTTDELRDLHQWKDSTGVPMRTKFLEEQKERLERFDIDPNSLPTEDWNSVRWQMPTSTVGPKMEIRERDLFQKFFETPYRTIGEIFDYLARKPVFTHYLARGAQEVAPEMWRHRRIEKELLDELHGLGEMGGLRHTDQELDAIARSIQRGELDDITIRFEDTMGHSPRGDRVMGYAVEDEGLVVIDRGLHEKEWKRIEKSMKAGDEIGLSAGAPAGRVPENEVLARLGVEPREVVEYIQQNGGLETFIEWTKAHEVAHVRLRHSEKTQGSAWMTENSVNQEMEATRVALKAIGADEMASRPVSVFNFEDARAANEYLDIIAGRADRLSGWPSGGIGEQKVMTRTEQLLDNDGDHAVVALRGILKRAEELGFERGAGESTYSFGKRVFDRLWEAEGEVVEQVFQYAVNNTVPFIDNIPVMSFASKVMRNAAPFWWAEERFLKRLAMSTFHSPEQLVKAKMTYLGGRESGFIQEDTQGNPYFTYYTAGVSHDAVARVLALMTGGQYAHMPSESMEMRGRLILSLPGLEELGKPNASPPVTIPLRAIGRKFPEVRAFTDWVVGPFAAREETSFWQMWVPSTLLRFHNAMDPERAAEVYASTSLQSLQHLMAHEYDMEVDPETGLIRPQHPERFQRDAQELTHVSAIMRLIYGFGGLAPPEIAFPEGEEARDDLFRWTQTLGFDEGLRRWREKWPNATAYTVFQTETPAGVGIPAVEEIGNYLEQHGDFVEQIPHAAAYLMPRPVGVNEFDQRAWNKMLEHGLRERKGLDEMYRSIVYAIAAPEYFEMKEEYEEVLERYKGTPEAAEVRNRWSQWSTAYKTMNPTFREELETLDRQNVRNRVIDDLKWALSQSDVPDNQSVRALRPLFTSYLNFEEEMKALRNYQSGPHRNYRTYLRESFAAYAKDYVEQMPEAEPFYHRIILPELQMTDEEVEQRQLAPAGG